MTTAQPFLLLRGTLSLRSRDILLFAGLSQSDITPITSVCNRTNPELNVRIIISYPLISKRTGEGSKPIEMHSGARGEFPTRQAGFLIKVPQKKYSFFNIFYQVDQCQSSKSAQKKRKDLGCLGSFQLPPSLVN